jgi:hypothetical protein
MVLLLYVWSAGRTKLGLWLRDFEEVEPRETPDVHSGDGGEERSDETDCYEKNLEEATNSALELASSVEGEQHVAQPLVQNVSEEGGEDERIDRDEDD